MIMTRPTKMKPWGSRRSTQLNADFAWARSLPLAAHKFGVTRPGKERPGQHVGGVRDAAGLGRALNVLVSGDHVRGETHEQAQTEQQNAQGLPGYPTQQ